MLRWALWSGGLETSRPGDQRWFANALASHPALKERD